MYPEQHSIVAMLNLVREKRGFYVNTPSIECLDAFINGWLLANANEVADIHHWNNFGSFIQRRFRFDETVGYVRALRFHSLDTFEAFTLFFELFNESLGEGGGASHG